MPRKYEKKDWEYWRNRKRRIRNIIAGTTMGGVGLLAAARSKNIINKMRLVKRLREEAKPTMKWISIVGNDLPQATWWMRQNGKKVFKGAGQVTHAYNVLRSSIEKNRWNPKAYRSIGTLDKARADIKTQLGTDMDEYIKLIINYWRSTQGIAPITMRPPNPKIARELFTLGDSKYFKWVTQEDTPNYGAIALQALKDEGTLLKNTTLDAVNKLTNYSKIKEKVLKQQEKLFKQRKSAISLFSSKGKKKKRHIRKGKNGKAIVVDSSRNPSLAERFAHDTKNNPVSIAIRDWEKATRGVRNLGTTYAQVADTIRRNKAAARRIEKEGKEASDILRNIGRGAKDIRAVMNMFK